MPYPLRLPIFPNKNKKRTFQQAPRNYDRIRHHPNPFESRLVWTFPCHSCHIHAQRMGGEMRSVRLLLLTLAVLLSGCLSDSEKTGLRETLLGEGSLSKQELAAKDDAVCTGYGAKPGTDAYISCRVAQDQRRDVRRYAPMDPPPAPVTRR